LPNNPDEDIIRANPERRAQWQAHRNRKLYLGVVWLGHWAHLRLAFDMAQTLQRLWGASQQGRSLDLPRHDPHHAETLGTK